MFIRLETTLQTFNNRYHEIIMAKKTNITAKRLIEMYMDDILMNGESSQSVYAFAKKNNFDESAFYEHFNSFEMLEKSIFKVFCSNTIEMLEATEEYNSYDSKHKLLSFYYTFFELLTANRSYVFLRLKQNKDKLQSLRLLGKLREEFIYFVRGLGIQPVDFKNEKINKVQDKGIEESAWVQLLLTMKFWLEDESPAFEKTDMFIEKSIKAQFDLMDITPIKSVLDFAKFIWHEKIQK